jgi:hypothetical protein
VEKSTRLRTTVGRPTEVDVIDVDALDSPPLKARAPLPKPKPNLKKVPTPTPRPPSPSNSIETATTRPRVEPATDATLEVPPRPAEREEEPEEVSFSTPRADIGPPRRSTPTTDSTRTSIPEATDESLALLEDEAIKFLQLCVSPPPFPPSVAKSHLLLRYVQTFDTDRAALASAYTHDALFSYRIHDVNTSSLSLRNGTLSPAEAFAPRKGSRDLAGKRRRVFSVPFKATREGLSVSTHRLQQAKARFTTAE